jgi:flagellar biosynthesis/type III secretory pathway protein FliH
MNMLSPADEERERCESRRKAQLDYNTAMRVAHMEDYRDGRMEGYREGRVEGYREGLKIGMIHVGELMLKRPETPTEQLLTLSMDDLSRLAEDLLAQAAATMKRLPEQR